MGKLHFTVGAHVRRGVGEFYSDASEIHNRNGGCPRSPRAKQGRHFRIVPRMCGIPCCALDTKPATITTTSPGDAAGRQAKAAIFAGTFLDRIQTFLSTGATVIKMDIKGMKAVILAGGMGTRISEESHLKPKPMIEIGGKPIIWHIMKIYSAHGVNDFVVCCGYKGYVIKEYFANYFLHLSDVTFDLKENQMQVHQNQSEPWKVTLVDTGDLTMTGGRIKRVGKYLDPDRDFLLTYGDGVGDVNITELVKLHERLGKKATVTAIQPAGRFGALKIERDIITGFQEKPQGDGGWINGGFFVLSPKTLDLISGDTTVWENEPLERLAHENELVAYMHRGFWQPMDTLRDKNHLEELWATDKAPWKIWR